MLLRPNEIIHQRYRIDSLLGQGGMGLVYRALDQQRDEMVAIKLLILPPGQSHQRFQREFRVMQRFDHPHVIPSYDSGVYDGMPFLVMALADGGDLCQHLGMDGSGKGQRQAVDSLAALLQRLEIALQVCEALAYIHRRGVIHRDVKPENIMLARPVEAGQPLHTFLMDFGLAKSHHESLVLTQEGMVMGTVGYMSPEQARGYEIDARSDLYALGALIYWLMLGHTPHQGSSLVEVLLKQRREPVQPLAQYLNFVPPALDMLLLRLLEREASDRYANASDVSRALRDILQHSALPVPSAASPAAPSFRPSQNPTQTPTQLFRTAIIGRDAVLAELAHLLQDRASPSSALPHLLLEGEAGMGVSRIVREFRRDVRASGYLALVLFQRDSVPQPYQVWREGLRQFRRSHPELFASASEGLHDPLTTVLPELGGRGIDLDLSAELARQRVYRALASLLARLCQAHPLVLLVDNIHASDEASIALLRYILRSEYRHQLITVIGIHPELASAETLHTIRAMTSRHIHLAPLKAEASAQLIRALLGNQAIDTALLRYVAELAGGRPLFMEEILNALLAAKHITRQGERWVWDRGRVSLPASIEGVLLARLQQLPEAVQRTAAIASVLGLRVAYPLLVRLHPIPEGELLDHLDRLLRSGFIRDAGDDRYRFSPGLLRTLLHDRLPLAERQQYHAQVADMLLAQREQAGTMPELEVTAAELADHYAETAEPARAIPYALEAAAHAETIYANDISEQYYRLALRYLTEDVRIIEVSLKLGKVLERVGYWQEVEALYQALLIRTAQSSQVLHAKVLHALGRVTQKQGDLHASARYLYQALAQSERRLELYSDLGRTLIYQGKLAKARALYQQALTLASSLPDPALQAEMTARAQLDIGLLEYHGSNWHEAIRWLSAARSTTDPETQRPLLAKIHHRLGVCYQSQQHLKQAKAHFEEALARYQAIGDIEASLSVKNNLVNNLMYSNQTGQAEELLQDIVQQAYQVGEQRIEAAAKANLGMFYLDREDVTQALESLQSARALFAQLGFTHHQVHALLQMASCYSLQDEPQEAQRTLEEAETLLQQHPHQFYQTMLMLGRAEKALHAGNYPQALSQAQQAQAAIDAHDFTILQLPLSLVLAQAYYALGQDADARSSLASIDSVSLDDDPLMQHKLHYLQCLLAEDGLGMARARFRLREMGLEAFLQLSDRLQRHRPSEPPMLG